MLVASIRSTTHLLESARLGADVATMPPDVIKKLFNHPLTDKGLAAFLKDWERHRPIHPGLGGQRPLARRDLAAAKARGG